MIELTQAAQDVLAERKRQINEEGWSLGHDDQHVDCALARAAASYALVGIRFIGCEECIRKVWPFSTSWWKPTGRRRSLVKAGALILAEIERLDRVPTSRPDA